MPISRTIDYKPKEPQPELPAEWSAIVNRLCRIQRDEKSGWILMIFEDEVGRSGEQPRWILPSELLDDMERVANENPEVLFRVSGQTTVYDKQLYILVGQASAQAPAPPPPEPTPAVQEKPAPTSRPGEAESPSKEPPAESIEEIMARLLKEKPGEPVVPSTPKPQEVKPVPSVAPAPAAKDVELAASPDQLVIDRLVRVLPVGVGKWMQVTFESDNNLQEPPLRLLPCRELETAEKIAAAAGDRKMVRFRVSGRVTQYKGRRYLLLKKVVLERDMGQF